MDRTLKIAIIHKERGHINLNWTDTDGENSGPIEAPLSEKDWATIQLLVTSQRILTSVLSSRAAADAQSARDEFCKIGPHLWRLTETVGSHLFRVLLFDEKLRLRLQEAIRQTGEERGLLRIELIFTNCRDPELEMMPWESLYDQDKCVLSNRGYLCRMSRLVIVRHREVHFGPPFLVQRPRVLLVVSRPLGLGPVLTGDLIGKLEALNNEGRITLKTLIQKELSDQERKELKDTAKQPDITAGWDSFKNALSEGWEGESDGPDIVHFIGHGTLKEQGVDFPAAGALAFVDKDEKAKWIFGESFAEEVGRKSRHRLVVLQACETAVGDHRAAMSSVALKLVSENVFAVIGMQGELANTQGVSFAEELYRELADGRSIGAAVYAAREAVEKADAERKGREASQVPFVLPVLYLSKEAALFPPPIRGEHNSSAQVSTDPKLRCAKCKAYINADAKFCSNCGAPTRQTVTDQPKFNEGPGPMVVPTVEGNGAATPWARATPPAVQGQPG